MLGAFQDSLLSLLFPQPCQVCSGSVEHRADGTSCAPCWTSTRLFDHSEMLCQKCGAFLGKERAPVPVFCHRCDDHRYHRARALGVYEKALASAVIDLKHRPVLPSRIKDKI